MLELIVLGVESDCRDCVLDVAVLNVDKVLVVLSGVQLMHTSSPTIKQFAISGGIVSVFVQYSVIPWLCAAGVSPAVSCCVIS